MSIPADVKILQTSERGSSEYNEAFERVYNDYRDKMWSLCLKYMKDREKADDMLQEVFLTVHLKIYTFKGKSSFGTWLHRVTVNECLQHIRNTKKYRENELRVDTAVMEGFEIPDTKPAAFMFVENELDAQKVIDRAKLAPAQKENFMLYMQGLDSVEIAQMTGRTPQAVRSSVCKAKQIVQNYANKRHPGSTFRNGM